MLEKIPGNFKSMYKSQVDGLKCNLCIEEKDTNSLKIMSRSCLFKKRFKYE